MAESVTNPFPVSLAIGLGTATVLVLVYAVLGGKQADQKKVAAVGTKTTEPLVKAKTKTKEKVSSKINAGKENSAASSKKASTVEKASGSNVLSDKTNTGEKEGSESAKKSSKRKKKKSKSSVESINVASASKPSKPSSDFSESEGEEFTVVPSNAASKKGNSSAKSVIPTTGSSAHFGPGRFDLLSTENVDLIAEKPVRKAGDSQKRKEAKSPVQTVAAEVSEITNDGDSDSFVTVGAKSSKKKKKASASASSLNSTPVVFKEDAPVATPAAIAVPKTSVPDVVDVPLEEKSGKKKKSKKKSTKSDVQESNGPSIESAEPASVVDAKGKEEGEFETVTKKKKKTNKSNPIEEGSSDASLNVKESTERIEASKIEEISSVPAESNVNDKTKKKKKKAASTTTGASSQLVNESSGVSHPPSANKPVSRPPTSSASNTSTSSSSQPAKVTARPQASRASQMAFLVDAFPTISVEVISSVLAEHNGSIEDTMVALISRDSFVSSASLYTPSGTGTISTKKSQDEGSSRPEQGRKVREEEDEEEEEEEDESEEEDEVDPDGWKVEKKKGKKGSSRRSEKGKEVSSSEADEEESRTLAPKSGKKGSNVVIAGGSSNSFLSLLEMNESEDESGSKDSEESEHEPKKPKSRKGKNGKKRS